MKTIFLVDADEAAVARAMEQRLLALPEASGILFVGVDVVQNPLEHKREALFKVFIGCSRERDPQLMDAIARRYLRDLIPQHQLVVEARRGFSRPSDSD